jgi:hypothetical protein
MDFIKNLVTNKINLLGFFIAFIGAYMQIPNYFEVQINPLTLSQDIWISLDPSWGVALNYIKLKNLTWGTDVAFTYGPLAPFCTRAGWGENKFSFLFFDMFMFINFFLVFFISFKKSLNKIITALIIVVFSVMTPLWLGSSNSMILMMFLVFWIRISMDNPKAIFYFFQICIITIVFYIKFNSGLIAFPLFFAGIIYNIFNNKNKTMFLIVYSLLPFVFIFILSKILNVSLIDYYYSGLEMIKGFNDVMFSDGNIKNSSIYSIIILVLITGVYLIKISIFNKSKLFKNLTLLFLIGTSTFVLYKQSFVRADGGHVVDFFIFMPLLLLCNLDFHINKNKWVLNILTLLILFIPFKFLAFEQNKQIEITSKFPKSNYISEFKRFTTISGMHLTPNNYKLPNSVLQRIEDKTIDVFPWDILLLLQNNLNYHPRPVIQSYTAYTKYLENMNFEHYNSNNAPEFVIYEIAAIDNRYAFLDESKVSVALVKNYSLVETFEFDGRNLHLLQKNKEFKPIKFEKIDEYAMILNTPLVPKKDVFYEIDIYNSYLGKAFSIFNHAPDVNLEIKTSDGYLKEYRTSKMLLESGIFCDEFIYETKNVSSLFNSKNENLKIKYYNIKPFKNSYFNDKIRITEYKITQ